MVRRAGTAAVAVAVVLAGGATASGCGTSSLPAGAHRGRTELVLIEATRRGSGDASLACGAETAAGQLGDSIRIQGPAHRSAAGQIAVVNAVIATKPDAVLIAPDGRNALLAPIQSMKSAGIKVIRVTGAGGARAAYREGVDGVRRAAGGTPAGSIPTGEPGC